MPFVPEGRFIPVNMDRCQDIMGRGAVRARYTGKHFKCPQFWNLALILYATNILFVVPL